jgi:protein tyrosine phosphatase type 4A
MPSTEGRQEQAKELERKVEASATARPTTDKMASTDAVAPVTNTRVSGTGGGSVMIATKPSLIDLPPMHFLIMDAPRQGNLHLYIKEMRKNHVTDVVRVCEPTYRAGGELSSAGIALHEMEYKDGTSPSKELIMAWLQLVEKTFYGPTSASTEACIAVHCVAGLGRAPVMVAIALIEFANMDPVEAVSFIRARRRGAINEKQLLYLEGYKKQYKRSGGTEGSCGCVIS